MDLTIRFDNSLLTVTVIPGTPEPIELLDDDILTRIFSYLDPENLLNIEKGSYLNHLLSHLFIHYYDDHSNGRRLITYCQIQLHL